MDRFSSRVLADGATIEAWRSVGNRHRIGRRCETVVVMHVRATKETCAVSSLCVYRVPEVFDQDDDGMVEVVDPYPPAELHQDVRSAARGCPTRSIILE